MISSIFSHLFSWIFPEDTVLPSEVIKPDQVQSVLATKRLNTILITWSAISNIDHYDIYRATGSIDGRYLYIGSSTSESFIDTEVIYSFYYYYFVVAVDSDGNLSIKSDISGIYFSQPLDTDLVNIFTKENLICIYRENDADSLAYAQRYKTLRGLDDTQLVPIPCSNIEILDSYTTFLNEVEIPILNALSSDELSNRIIYGIVLMPFVPGGFLNDGDKISSTSRLSRIYKTFNKKTGNNLFDRKIFKRYDGFDLSNSLICTRIDAPSLIINDWFTNIENSVNYSGVQGSFYIDPFSAYTQTGSSEYTTDLSDFSENYIAKIGLPVIRTTKPLAVKDALFPNVTDDSFVWGWGADRGSTSFFRISSNTRAFFYNADFDGASTVRDIDYTGWPILAIRQGYLSSAGSLSNLGIDSFLRPRPFVDALFRGATLGEAFLFSQPKLETSIVCLGDPLMTFFFSSSPKTTTLISPDISWANMKECLSESISYLYRKTNILKDLRNMIASGNNDVVQETLDYVFDDLYKQFDETSWKTDYANVTAKLINFVVDRNASTYDFAYPNFNQYLTETGNKISQLALSTLQDDELTNSLLTTNIDSQGSWVFEAVLEHYSDAFVFYHIELQIAKNLEDFDNSVPLLSKDTLSSNINWYIQDSDGNFKAIDNSGITSNYEGKDIKYISKDDEALQTGDFYWFRIRQKDDSQNYEWKYFRRIIFY